MSLINIDDIKKSYFLISYIWEKTENIKIDIDTNNKSFGFIFFNEFGNWLGSYRFEKINIDDFKIFDKQYNLDIYLYNETFLDYFKRLIVIIEFDKIDTIRFINEANSSSNKHKNIQVELEQIILNAISPYISNYNKLKLFKIRNSQIVHNIIIDEHYSTDIKSQSLDFYGFNNLLRRIENKGTIPYIYRGTVILASDLLIYNPNLTINCFSPEINFEKNKHNRTLNYATFSILNFLTMQFIVSYLHKKIEANPFYKLSISEYIDKFNQQKIFFQYYKDVVINDINISSSTRINFLTILNKIEKKLESPEYSELMFPKTNKYKSISNKRTMNNAYISYWFEKILNNISSLNTILHFIEAKEKMISNSFRDLISVKSNDLNIKLQKKIFYLTIIATFFAIISVFTSFKTEIIQYFKNKTITKSLIQTQSLKDSISFEKSENEKNADNTAYKQ